MDFLLGFPMMIMAMMRKVMHHSEEIYLFVLINKLTTHFNSEPSDLIIGFEKQFSAFAFVRIL